jgi:hypothetical protein
MAGSYRVTADALSKLATDNLTAKFRIGRAAARGGQAVKRQSLGLAGGPRWLLVGESDGSTAQHPLRLCRIAGHPELAVIDQRLSQQLGS